MSSGKRKSRRDKRRESFELHRAREDAPITTREGQRVDPRAPWPMPTSKHERA